MPYAEGTTVSPERSQIAAAIPDDAVRAARQAYHDCDINEDWMRAALAAALPVLRRHIADEDAAKLKAVLDLCDQADRDGRRGLLTTDQIHRAFDAAGVVRDGDK